MRTVQFRVECTIQQVLFTFTHLAPSTRMSQGVQCNDPNDRVHSRQQIDSCESVIGMFKWILKMLPEELLTCDFGIVGGLSGCPVYRVFPFWLQIAEVEW
jgi:hypothetical protein